MYINSGQGIHLGVQEKQEYVPTRGNVMYMAARRWSLYQFFLPLLETVSAAPYTCKIPEISNIGRYLYVHKGTYVKVANSNTQFFCIK